jgi:hypothetical protein
LKNLALSSLLFLLLCSCSTALFNNYRKYDHDNSQGSASYTWFNSDTGRYLFQSSIDIFKNNFTGLLFIKQLDDSRRILFITETGIKIFDLELFEKDDFIVHYCMEQINRKSLLNALGNDFSLMIYNIPGDSRIKYMTEKNTGKLIIKSSGQSGTRYLKVNKKTGKIDEIISSGALTNKLNIRFFSASGEEPDSIIVSHYNLNFKIHLVRINEN